MKFLLTVNNKKTPDDSLLYVTVHRRELSNCLDQLKQTLIEFGTEYSLPISDFFIRKYTFPHKKAEIQPLLEKEILSWQKNGLTEEDLFQILLDWAESHSLLRT